MTFQERNDMVEKTMTKIKNIHDQYTSSSKVLNDEEWEAYINSMWAIPESFKGTNLQDFIGELVMTFCNDTERMQKKLRGLLE